jgi:TPR repeat protein
MQHPLASDDGPIFDPAHAHQLLKAKKHSDALAYIQSFIERGNAGAVIEMADIEYDAGNIESSKNWVRRAEEMVEAGNSEAAIYLASAYERGLGEGAHDERRAKSIAMLEHAAEHGYVSCAHALMTNYLYGLNGVKVSRQKFEYWARKAAQHGSEPAQQALAKLDHWPHVAPGE